MFDNQTSWVIRHLIKAHIKVFQSVINLYFRNHFGCSLESWIILFTYRLGNAFCSVLLRGQSHALWTVHSVG